MNDTIDHDDEVSRISREFSFMDTLSHLLRRSHFRSESLFAAVFGNRGLTSRQFALLVAIAQNPDSSQKIVGDAVALDVNTVSDTLRRMERKNLVERVASVSDGRSITVRLTRQGLEVLQGAVDDNKAFQAKISERLDADEAQQLKALLRKLLGFPPNA